MVAQVKGNDPRVRRTPLDVLRAADEGFYTFDLLPEEAAELLTLPTIIENRALNPNVVKQYARSMREGWWLKNGDTIALFRILVTGDLVLLNGQHRLGGAARAGVPVTLSFFLTEGTEGEARDLMRSYDMNRRRTLNERLKFSGDLESVGNDSRRHVIAGISAICILDVYLEHGINAWNALSDSERYWLFQGAREDVLWAAGLRDTFGRSVKGMKPLVPFGVLAAAIAIHRLAPEEGERFFSTMLLSEGIVDTDHPAYTLRDMILSAHTNGAANLMRKRGGVVVTGRLGQHVWWYNLAAYLWKAHCEQRTVKMMRLSAEPMGLVMPKLRGA